MADDGPRNERLVGADYWDGRFQPGGSWEHKGGRAQTREHAELFCRRTMLRGEARFTLLDVGCALGDAMPIMRRRFPDATLIGCDISPLAVQRATETFGSYAQFVVCSIDEVSGPYDVIVASNILEHFVDWQERARRLLLHCCHLCIATPLNQLRDGKPMEPSPDQEHQATFTERSLDFLVKEGLASRVRVAADYRKSWLRRHAFNAMRRALRRPMHVYTGEVVYEICAANAEPSCSGRGLHL